MTGADVLCDTLLAGEVDVCFANPGTSEMQFVAALDQKPAMRCVLGLFEGVVTGAADGYARMSGKPAATLLHLGPGLANGLANLHNAKRAGSPMVNIVGDHAAGHLVHDAPLTSDIESLARPMSDWVRRMTSSEQVQHDAMAAISAARHRPGQVATLVFPADIAWSDASFQENLSFPVSPAPLTGLEDETLQAAVAAVRSGRRCLLLLGGEALRQHPMADAARIAQATGAGVMVEQANARMEHGRGRHAPGRIPYLVDDAVACLKDYEVVILIGAKAPVAFFKYPGKPSVVTPPGVNIIELATRATDLAGALEVFRDALGISPTLPVARASRPPEPAAPDGPLTPRSLIAGLVAAMPENAIVCDEAISHSHAFGEAAALAPPHDLLQLTGGAIGIGPSLAAGAAIACPDRTVLAVQADGSALYTFQALWTQAREQLNVVTVLLSNRRYGSLYAELSRLGTPDPGNNARRLMDLENPTLDWVQLAQGLGVPACRVERAEDLTKAISRAVSAGGPSLIEAVL